MNEKRQADKDFQQAVDAKKRVARAVSNGKILLMKRSSHSYDDMCVHRRFAGWWSIFDSSGEKPENITKTINQMNCHFDGLNEVYLLSKSEEDLRERVARAMCAPLGMTIEEKDEFLRKITIVND